MNNRDCLGSVAKVAAHVIRSWSGYAGIPAPHHQSVVFHGDSFKFEIVEEESSSSSWRKETAASGTRGKRDADCAGVIINRLVIIQSCIILYTFDALFEMIDTWTLLYIRARYWRCDNKAQQMNIHRHITAQLLCLYRENSIDEMSNKLTQW